MGLILAVAAAEAASSLQPVVLENDLIRIQITPRAELAEFFSRATGRNYAPTPAVGPLFQASWKGRIYPADGLDREGDLFHVRFPEPTLRATLRVITHPRYFVLEVADVQPADVEWLGTEFPLRPLATNFWGLNGTYDPEFALAHMPLTANAECWSSLSGEGFRGYGIRCHRRWGGMVGARMAVLGVPFAEFKPLIQQIERENGLPCPMLEGQWARDSEPVRRSYLFVTDISEDNVDTIIEYAKLGHFGLILFLKDAFLETHGHFVVRRSNFPHGREGLKQAVDKIHAAGLGAGVHVFGPSISPNDPYVTPKPDGRLLAVDCPPLAEAIDEQSTILTLQGQPDRLPPKTTRSVAFPGNYLQIGDEILSYAGVEVGPPFRFTGCQRGVLGTTAAAHPAGTPVKGLLTLWGFFLGDPDTTLLDELTQNFADLFNYCGFDMVYFDASDGILSDTYPVWYYLNKWHLAYYRKFHKDVLYQYSMGAGTHLCWHIIPRSASADGSGDIKGYLDARYDAILGMATQFLRADVGWYYMFSQVDPDQIEYVCAKALGADASISIECSRQSLESLPRAREMIEMIGRWEQCRRANYFPEAVKAKLREKGRDFRLFPDGQGGWQLLQAAYEPPRTIPAFDGVANVWTVENDRPQACRGALAILRGTPPPEADYDDPQGLVLESFDDLTPYALSDTNLFEKYVIGGDKQLTEDGPVRKGVSQTFVPSAGGAPPLVRGGQGGMCGVYTARNDGEAGGWCAKGKRFPEVLDLSGYQALALWIHGDGQHETLRFQFRDVAGRHADWLVPIDFTGWKLQVFRTADASDFDWGRTEYVIFYYNDLPAKTTCTLKFDDLKALPKLRPPAPLSQPELRVNGQRIRFPVEVHPNECLTTDGMGGCTLWSIGMRPGRKITGADFTFLFQPGTNRIELTCDPAAGLPRDVTVRLARLWPLEE